MPSSNKSTRNGANAIENGNRTKDTREGTGTRPVSNAETDNVSNDNKSDENESTKSHEESNGKVHVDSSEKNKADDDDDDETNENKVDEDDDANDNDRENGEQANDSDQNDSGDGDEVINAPQTNKRRPKKGEKKGAKDDDNDDDFPPHVPDHLDRKTLKGVRAYLRNFDLDTAGGGTLDEDEVANTMIKLNRNVDHRIRYYSNPLDDMIDEENMVADFKKEELEYLVGHEFMKELAAALQDRKRRKGLDKRTLTWVKRAAGLNRKDYHSAHSAVGREETDSDQEGGRKGRVAPKRYTRGVAQRVRDKKKEEFIFKDNIGIKSLLDAIGELEGECGPYPVPFECQMRKQTRQMGGRSRQLLRSRRSEADSDDDDNEKEEEEEEEEEVAEKRIYIKKDNAHLLLKRPLVARLADDEVTKGIEQAGSVSDYFFGDLRDVLITKVLVNGEHVEADPDDDLTLQERKRELKRMRDRQYQKRKRDAKNRTKEKLQTPAAATPIRSNSNNRSRRYESESDEDQTGNWKPLRPFKKAKKVNRSLKGPVSLALLDWQRRQLWAAGYNKRQRKLLEKDIRANVRIPEYMAKLGIDFRLPPWESVNPAVANNVHDKPHNDPLRKKHSDDVYASWNHALINCLNGSARSWAVHEFFYSDVDRAWYNNNTFAREVAKLGILPTAKLTRREWSVVRRAMRQRPRRFSKRFIMSQLKERNNFRDIVRDLQQNPDSTNYTGFDIPAPISVGTTVTAYNKRFLILHRGKVLFHDVASARYLVQFERKELGFELCSDTEIARHGAPDILLPAAPSKITGASYQTGNDTFAKVGLPAYGSSAGPRAAPKRKDDVTCEEEVANILNKNPPQINPIEREVAMEKVAERETLATLMAVIDAANSRKEMLLEVMEKCNFLLVDRLPFGEGAPTNHVVSGYFEKHFSWLRANLETTNQTLQLAQFYLNAMYSKAFSST